MHSEPTATPHLVAEIRSLSRPLRSLTDLDPLLDRVAEARYVMLGEASHEREETLIVECDPRRIEEVRRNWPFLRDRRIDAYGGIASRVLD